MRNSCFNKLAALLLAVIMTLAFIPTASAAQSAALTADPGDPGSVTDKYINEANGREIAPA